MKSSSSIPVVYLFQGEDEFAIAQDIAELESRLGDPATASMNVTRMDGRSYDPCRLSSLIHSMPFIAKRRIVILTNPLAALNSQDACQEFLEILNNIPPTTALVLVEYRMLTDSKDLKQGKLHWLDAWARSAGSKVYMRSFPLPKGKMMEDLIYKQVKKKGGQITPQAAELLTNLVEDNPRLADQEISKLLDYVNYNRAIEVGDIELLTADYGQGDIFSMVDSLALQEGHRAMEIMHRLLSRQDPLYIFAMIVRQFRLLLMVRDVVDRGGQKGDVIREFNFKPFLAEKLVAQAKRFDMSILESIYHHLLALDEAIKSGQTSAELALDVLVAGLTADQSRN